MSAIATACSCNTRAIAASLRQRTLRRAFRVIASIVITGAIAGAITSSAHAQLDADAVELHIQALQLDEAAAARAAYANYADAAAAVETALDEARQWNWAWIPPHVFEFEIRHIPASNRFDMLIDLSRIDVLSATRDHMYAALLSDVAPASPWRDAVNNAMRRMHRSHMLEQHYVPVFSDGPRLRREYVYPPDVIVESVDVWSAVVLSHADRSIPDHLQQVLIDYELAIQPLHKRLDDAYQWLVVFGQKLIHISRNDEDDQYAARALEALDRNAGEMCDAANQIRLLNLRTVRAVDQAMPENARPTFRMLVWPQVYTYLDWRGLDDLNDQVSSALDDPTRGPRERNTIQSAWRDTLVALASTLRRIDAEYAPLCDPQIARQRFTAHHRDQRARAHRRLSEPSPDAMAEFMAYADAEWSKAIDAHSAHIHSLLNNQSAHPAPGWLNALGAPIAARASSRVSVQDVTRQSWLTDTMDFWDTHIARPAYSVGTVRAWLEEAQHSDAMRGRIVRIVEQFEQFELRHETALQKYRSEVARWAEDRWKENGEDASVDEGWQLLGNDWVEALLDADRALIEAMNEVLAGDEDERERWQSLVRATRRDRVLRELRGYNSRATWYLDLVAIVTDLQFPEQDVFEIAALLYDYQRELDAMLDAFERRSTELRRRQITGDADDRIETVEELTRRRDDIAQLGRNYVDALISALSAGSATRFRNKVHSMRFPDLFSRRSPVDIAYGALADQRDLQDEKIGGIERLYQAYLVEADQRRMHVITTTDRFNSSATVARRVRDFEQGKFTRDEFERTNPIRQAILDRRDLESRTLAALGELLRDELADLSCPPVARAMINLADMGDFEIELPPLR